MTDFDLKSPQKSKSLCVRRVKVILFDGKRRPGVGKLLLALLLVSFSLMYLSIFTFTDESDESFEVNNFGSNQNLLVKKTR